MEPRHINRNVSFLYEAKSHIDAFQLERFREFYHQSASFGHWRFAFPLGSLDACKDEGVDDFSCVLRHTAGTCELTIFIFGHPDGPLLDAGGSFTEESRAAIHRIESCRERFCAAWLRGSPPLAPRHFLLTEVSFHLFIGRRRLGAEAFEAFREALEHQDGTGGIRLVPNKADRAGFGFRWARQQAQLTPERLTHGKAAAIQSYDHILDQARLVALEPFPFPDQDLLRTIVSETDNTHVLEVSLKRLERTPANDMIFSRFLRCESESVRREAILGATDISALLQLLSHDPSNADLIRTRIAILNRDEEEACKVALRAARPEAEYAAIEALTDRRKLAEIANRYNGKAHPRAKAIRTLVAAREALLNRDAEALDRLQKDASFEISVPIGRMKATLQAQAKIPPVVFISYRRESEEHSAWVMRLAADLRESGINALLDEWELDLGESLSDYMALQIGRSDVMLFIITEKSVEAVEQRDGRAIKFEFQVANARRYHEQNFRIIGILRSGDRPPRHIADNLYLDFRNDEQYRNALERLLDSLLGRRKAPPVRPVFQ